MSVVTILGQVNAGIQAAKALIARASEGGWRPCRSAGIPRQPRPPRLLQHPRREVVLTPRERLVRSSLLIAAAMLFGIIGDLSILGQVQHLVAQQQLSNSFRAQLADGTAPVSEGTVDGVLLTDGAPVAILDIPSIGVHQIVVEGTNSGTTKSGPGHRRDTVLPGQSGVSVIMGRAAAFGGSFSRLQELQPGTKFSVITGQGRQVFEVIGLRYAGDPAPRALAVGQSRLILETARGAPFAPTGVARVDAVLTSTTQPAGIRQSNFFRLPATDRELAGDPSTSWALIFALQFFVVVEVAAIWALRAVGARKTWIVFLPVVILGGLLVADQIVRLLPNLL